MFFRRIYWQFCFVSIIALLSVPGVILATTNQLNTDTPDEDRPPILWEPSFVECSIGDGSGPTDDIVVVLTARENINDLDLRIVPELSQFVEAIPNQIESLAAGESREIHLQFSVAPGAIEQQYDGTIQIRSGKRVIAVPLPVVVNVDYGDIEVSADAKVLSRAATGDIVAVDDWLDGQALRYVSGQNGAEWESVELGDIVVSGVSSTTPMGFLGRVVSIAEQIDGGILYTVPATLQEVFTSGTIQYSGDLGNDGITVAEESILQPKAASSGMIEFFADDIPIVDTLDAQILADGRLALGVNLDFTYAVSSSELRYLRFAATTREELDIGFKFNVPVGHFDREHLLSGQYFAPITVWAGFVPVVLVPQMRLYAEVEGSASVGVETRVIQNATQTLGMEYTDGDWSVIRDLNYIPEWEEPHAYLSAELKGSVGPQYSLLVYGLVGPYSEFMGFVELDVDIYPPPVSWELWGGLEYGMGVRTDILGTTVSDWESPLNVGIRVLLAESQENPGEISGRVTDAATGAALSGVNVSVLDDGGVEVGSGLSDGGGAYQIEVPAGECIVEFTKLGYQTVTYYDVGVREGETVYLEPVLQIDESYIGIGQVAGRILNALSGTGVGGVTINLRDGMNSQSGAVVASTLSTSDGSYRIEGLAAGNYTGEASKVGYSNVYFGVLCLGGRVTGNQNAVITPILPDNQVRIVLTWGASPRDLDSHTTGPLPDGSEFHMYYPYAFGRSPWPEDVALDLDDTSSYGPETTTIFRQNPGVYRFMVHDYTNRGSTSSTGLSSSEAQVRVYGDEGLIASFPVPTGRVGTWWTVFEMENGIITPVNTIGNSTTSVTGDATTTLSNDILDVLPPKSDRTAFEVEKKADAHGQFALLPNSPNPFNPSTEIHFEVPRNGTATLAIYDVSGRRIRTLIDGYIEKGPQQISWHGRDDGGRAVPSGVYFYRLEAEGYYDTRRMTLVK